MNNNTGFKVSVLMLTYNQERYINEAIRSVMPVSYTHLTLPTIRLV